MNVNKLSRRSELRCRRPNLFLLPFVKQNYLPIAEQTLPRGLNAPRLHQR